MTDQRPPEQEALWREIRRIEPGPGARERVAQGLDSRIRRRGVRLLAIAAPIALAATVALMVILVDRSPGERAAGGTMPTVVDVTAASQGARSLAAGDRIGPDPVDVTGHLRAAMAQGRIDVVGPARVLVTQHHVSLVSGMLTFEGAVDISAPRCRARVSGKGKAAVVDARLEITVFAGSAEVSPPVAECHVIELVTPSPAPPAHRSPAPGIAPALPAKAEAAPDLERAPTLAPDRLAKDTAPSLLQRQVDAYWAAQRLAATDATAAVSALREHRRRWPRAPIRQEVDLAILDLLVEMGRIEPARQEASRFLRRYPNSPRASEVRRIADE